MIIYVLINKPNTWYNELNQGFSGNGRFEIVGGQWAVNKEDEEEEEDEIDADDWFFFIILLFNNIDFHIYNYYITL